MVGLTKDFQFQAMSKKQQEETPGQPATVLHVFFFPDLQKPYTYTNVHSSQLNEQHRLVAEPDHLGHQLGGQTTLMAWATRLTTRTGADVT